VQGNRLAELDCFFKFGSGWVQCWGGSNGSMEIAMGDVIVLIGAGSIGQAIARRVSAGKHAKLERMELYQRQRDRLSREIR